MKKLTGLTFALCLLASVGAWAVDPPPIDGDPDPIPVDGGATLLLAAGATYAYKMLRKKKAVIAV